MPGLCQSTATELDICVAWLVAAAIEDGACPQTGIGGLPSGGLERCEGWVSANRTCLPSGWWTGCHVVQVKNGFLT